MQAGIAETGASRRAFVAGAGAAAAGLALGRVPAVGAGSVRCAGRPPGIRRNAIALSADGRTLWTADTGGATITAHAARGLRRRRSIEVGDAPASIAVAGRRALVTTGLYDEPGLALVDLRSGRVLERFDVGRGPAVVAVVPGGSAAVVAAGGARGRLTRIDLERGSVDGHTAVGGHPRGVVLTRDGRHALVALNGDAAVAVVDVRRNRLVRRIDTAPFPFLLAVAPGGDTAFVSHNGFADRRVSRLDLESGRARGALRGGPEPAGIAFAGAGTVLVAARGDGTIGVHDARTGRRRRRIRIGGRPRALVVNGRRAYAADEETGVLWSIEV